MRKEGVKKDQQFLGIKYIDNQDLIKYILQCDNVQVNVPGSPRAQFLQYKKHSLHDFLWALY